MIRVPVDLTNPGQFFACCGLFELAHRLWPDLRGHFEGREFLLSGGDLKELVVATANAPLTNVVPGDKSASPMLLGPPFSLRLDWWKDRLSEGVSLKPWAGTMLASRIALAMQRELTASLDRGLFDDSHVVYGLDEKKVEPFYFDSRRGSNALPLDVGFSADALGIEAVAYPATEFLTLIGLQRFRPAVERTRVFRYRAWREELPITLAALVTAGAIHDTGPLFQFENAFRTDQRKHKAFSSATPAHGDR